MLKTPVIFIIFNRPDNTQRVFKSIRQMKPSKLLVIADGPRPDRIGEAQNCADTRAIIEQVDWECQVLTNYSDSNLGCGIRISTGMDWAFSQVEEAIILEDDCLPHPNFFQFCEELLERYRHDTRVMQISGNQHLLEYEEHLSKYSYYFSRYPLGWGWATWRRAWQLYDFQMKHFQEFIDDGWLDKMFNEKRAVRIWTNHLQGAFDNPPYTWDFQWFFTCFSQHGLSIHPTANLVSNIGFDGEATHTDDRKNPWASLSTKAIEFPLNHPPFIMRDVWADDYFQNTAMDQNKLKRLKLNLQKLFRNSFRFRKA